MQKLNLIKTDLRRLKRDKSVLIVFILMLVSILLSELMIKLIDIGVSFFNSSDVQLSEEEMEAMRTVFGYISFNMAMSFSSIGIMIALACSIFSGKDFSFKTIRNKILTDNSRNKIYLSILAVSLILGLIMYSCSIALTTILHLLLWGYQDFLPSLLLRSALGFLPYISIITIANFISMLTKSQILGVILNLAIAYVIASVMSLVVMFIQEGVLLYILQGIPYFIINEIFSLSSMMTMQISLEAAPSLSLILRSQLVPLAYIAIAMILGMRIFKKTDIN